MAFPPIRWCVVCEDIRREEHGLVSLLGFYGVVPAAEIRVPDLARPIERLSFFMLAEGVIDGLDHSYRFEVLDPSGQFLVKGTDSKTGAGNTGRPQKLTLAVTTMSPHLRQVGVYRVVFRVDGQEHFVSTFTVALDSNR